jgi:hypothetical protein
MYALCSLHVCFMFADLCDVLLPVGLLPGRYVRYMGNIRLIQEYLVRKADKHGLPRVENSNVDRSVAIIHLTVMG